MSAQPFITARQATAELERLSYQRGVLHFDKSAVLTTEDCGDTETDCESYRATWEELKDRSILITRIEHNDARASKPALWVVDALSRVEVAALIRMIRKQLASERTRGEIL